MRPPLPPGQGPYYGSQGGGAYGSPGKPDYMDQPNGGAGMGRKGGMTAENIFVATGLLLLATLCLVPVWNAAALLSDENYTFWVGGSVPGWLGVLCVLVVVLYAITILAFFKYSKQSVRTEQTIMMIANIFITLLGLSLMLLSLPLSRQAIETYNNLMHRCDYSEQTHRMYEYSQVLHNIRATPACSAKYSVEECAGYEEAPPYTTFLKTLETEFRCSGFCYKNPALLGGQPPAAAGAGSTSPDPARILTAPEAPGGTAAQAGNAPGAGAVPNPKPAAGAEPSMAEKLQQGAAAPGAGAEKASLLKRASTSTSTKNTARSKRRQHQDQVTQIGLLEVAEGRRTHTQAGEGFGTWSGSDLGQAQEPAGNEIQIYPPTLFSDANYKASCEGMAARDMRNFAGDVGFQTFYQGIYLVLIAIATGFLKLIGFCVRKDTDRERFAQGKFGGPSYMSTAQ